MIQKLMTKMSDKEKKIFYIALVFVSFALVDRLFFGPTLKQLQTIDDQIEQQKSSIMRDMRLLSYKDRIESENKVFQKYFTDKTEDDDVVNAQFLRAIEKLATDTSITLVKSNPSEKKEGANYTQYFANLDCSGSLKNVITFMHAINSTDGLLKVARFSMTPKRGTEEEVNASMTVVKMIMPAL